MKQKRKMGIGGDVIKKNKALEYYLFFFIIYKNFINI